MNLIKIWTFPQEILGSILNSIYKRNGIIKESRKSEKIKNVDIHIIKEEINYAGISLGSKIFISSNYPNMEQIIMHEEGHVIQSMIFGPLYLIVVGLPSILFNLMSRVSENNGSGKFSENYYKRFPENWADSLGGLKRE